MRITLTPLRLALVLLLLPLAAFAYYQFHSAWVEVGERDFERRVLQDRIPALVYFDTAIGCRGGDWVFRNLSRKWPGVLDVFYVNSVDHPGLAGRYGVSRDVVFVLFERGQAVKRATAPEVLAAVAAKNSGVYSDENFLAEMENFANLRH